jgi:hypothetical protein
LHTVSGSHQPISMDYLSDYIVPHKAPQNE